MGLATNFKKEHKKYLCRKFLKECGQSHALNPALAGRLEPFENSTITTQELRIILQPEGRILPAEGGFCFLIAGCKTYP